MHNAMSQPTCIPEGLFAPDSVIRKLTLESSRLLGGGRALLLQLAHPLIAAAVVEHSRFQANPLRRLENTLDLTQNIIHGDRRTAERALSGFHARHAHVRGSLPQAVGAFPAGTQYSGDDPDLKLWVHATVIDTLLVTHERFVRPLTCPERVRFYQDAKLLAYYLGIPSEMVPPTLEEFQRHMQTMLQSETLTVSAAARVLAAATVIKPEVGFVARGLARMVRFVTAGLLPEPIRSAYGLVWDARRQAVLDAVSRTSRMLVPVLPMWIRRTSPSGRSGLARWVIRLDTHRVRSSKMNSLARQNP
jgi:uncharacterized protein (DUF2236 family)